MILAIETATHICSVSLQDADGKIHEKRTERKGSHSELLFIFIRELMEEHQFSMDDLKAVLVSSGPGSYTGLRIAASAVKGMLFGSEVNIYAANTLAGFAQSSKEGVVHAVINARRNHLYHQSFEKKNETLSLISESKILELEDINPKLNEGDSIIGTGINRLDEEKLACLNILDESGITASNLIHLFRGKSSDIFFVETTAEKLESNYLSSSQVNNTRV